MGKENSGLMTFGGHLEVLRRMFFRVLAVLAVLAIGIFCLKDVTFELLFAPTSNEFCLYSWIEKISSFFGGEFRFDDFSVQLISTELSAQFMTHLTSSLYLALLLASPYILFELYAFVAPALYANERKSVRKALIFSSVLFYMGVVLSYFVIFPLMLNFFAGYQVTETIPNTFALGSYISLFMSMILIFGIVFEFPSLIAVLSALGLVNRDSLKNLRRYAICIVLVLAAVITPSGDPFSLLVVSVPLYLLYEFSIIICRKGEVKALEE